MEKFKTFAESHLNEVKLSRVINKFNDDTRVVATISVYRCDKDKEENIKLTKEFADKTKSKGFGFVYVNGSWYEEAHEKVCDEVSLLIEVNEQNEDDLFNFLVSSAKLYNQDGFVFKGLKHEFGVYNKEGHLISSFKGVKVDNKLNFDSIYSKIGRGSHKGRNFVFEDKCTFPIAESLVYALIRRNFLEGTK